MKAKIKNTSGNSDFENSLAVTRNGIRGELRNFFNEEFPYHYDLNIYIDEGFATLIEDGEVWEFSVEVYAEV